MSRQPLPTRRPNISATTDWQGHTFTVTIGFDAAGNPGEVFCNHAKGDMASMLSDACVLVSIALQWGVPVADLGKSLGSVPTWINGSETQAPASPIGTIIAEIRRATE